MQYAVLLYVDSNFRTGEVAPEWADAVPAHVAFAEKLAARGIDFSGAPLHSIETATTVRVRDGKRLVSDGPFAETKEQLWGFYLIEAADLDVMIELVEEMWEAKHGTVEIRPCIPAEVDLPGATGARSK